MKIYTVNQAKKSILKRKSIFHLDIPKSVEESIKSIFGRVLSPQEVVTSICNDVKKRGDIAVEKWSNTIDNTQLQLNFEVAEDAISNSTKNIPLEQLNALKIAIYRVKTFHENQPLNSWFTNKLGGTLGQIVVPIQKIGIYVPGGTAPLPSTLIMSAIPAIVAGCQEIIVTTPPNKKGTIPDIILATCYLINEITNTKLRVFTIGGVQAISALAYGTESVPKVDKIVGPGNLFVTLSKHFVSDVVGIDGYYGPTEALIIADSSASPTLIAADLLAQAEHDVLAIPILLTDSQILANKVVDEVTDQIKALSRRETITQSLKDQGGIVITKDTDESITLSNEFAPEHLSLFVENPWKYIDKITNAGGIFIGESSCEVLGDYIAGPSHIMPTGGSARFSSPLSVLDFIKLINFINFDEKSSKELAKQSEIIASAENLDAHATSARRRYK